MRSFGSLLVFGMAIVVGCHSKSAGSSADAGAERDGGRPAKPQRFAFEAESGVCFGDCVPQLTSIDEDGKVTHTVTGPVPFGGTPVCPETKQHASAEDLDKLRRLALAANVAALDPSYPDIYTDHSRLTTTVRIDGKLHRIEHPDELPSLGGDAAKRYRGVDSLIELHREINRAGKTKEWLASCQRDAGARD